MNLAPSITALLATLPGITLDELARQAIAMAQREILLELRALTQADAVEVISSVGGREISVESFSLRYPAYTVDFFQIRFGMPYIEDDERELLNSHLLGNQHGVTEANRKSVLDERTDRVISLLLRLSALPGLQPGRISYSLDLDA